MTKLPEADAASGPDPTGAAWLAMTAEAAEPLRLAPLSREQCLSAAGMLLSAAMEQSHPCGPPQSIAERLAVAAGRTAAMAAWLSGVSQIPAGPAGHGDAQLLTQFAADGFFLVAEPWAEGFEA